MANAIKPIIIPLFILLLGFGLAGCGKGEDSTNPGTSSKTLPAAPAALLANEFPEVQAPESFRARFTVEGKGDFVVEVTRSWAPRGADRFYNLVKAGFYDHAPFFRNDGNFVVQFGIPAWPEVNAKFQNRNILDDHEVVSSGRVKSNKKWTLTFANAGEDTRSCQLFINLKNNSMLDPPNYKTFAPFGKVVEGMEVVSAIHVVGEMFGQPGGENGVNAQRLGNEGLPYIRKEFPLCDVIEKARIE